MPKREDSEADRAAAERAVLFMFGWFAHPVVYGDYPEVMRERVGDRLPAFTAEQSEALKGSADFLGVNAYTTMLAEDTSSEAEHKIGYFDHDRAIAETADPAWPQGSVSWFYKVPEGFRGLLALLGRTYPGMPLIVTENGAAAPGEDDPSVPLAQRLDDTWRVDYLNRYLTKAKEAIELDGVNLKGYFVWSLLDNLEWSDGYSIRFGIVRVDWDTLERTPKSSARFMSAVMALNAEVSQA